jgi:hypothetical protein
MVNLKHSSVFAGVLAGVAVLSISAGSLFGLQSVGVPLGPIQSETDKQASTKVTVPVASYKNTPAAAALTAALDGMPANWTKNSSRITSPQEPFPFSCVPDVAHPGVSFAQGYGINGKSIQIVTGAYTAGLGALTIKQQFEKVSQCAGDTWIGTVPVTGLGTEAYSSTVTKGGNATKIITWRNGDVITYLLAQNNNTDVLNNATTFNDALTAQLAPVCVDMGSKVEDAGRNVFSNQTFTGYLINDTVTIPQVPLPEAVSKPTLPIFGTDLTPKGFTYKNAIEKTPIPAPAQDVPTVDVPATPTYPVWPLLPTAPEEPIAPKAPAATPPMVKNVPIVVKDDKGPGCGWAFMATASPNFDAQAAEAKKTTDKTAATSLLRSEASNWQKSILSYWKDYSSYSAKVKAWEDYAKKVDTVRVAWDAIAEQWKAYYTKLANYENSVKAHDSFVKEQSDAKAKYDKEVEICKVRDDKKKADEEAKAKADADKAKTPSPSPTATPGATASPSPSASPTASPSPSSEDDKVTCPVEKPAIIDEKAPDVLPKPTEPADPRPVDQRK